MPSSATTPNAKKPAAKPRTPVRSTGFLPIRSLRLPQSGLTKNCISAYAVDNDPIWISDSPSSRPSGARMGNSTDSPRMLLNRATKRMGTEGREYSESGGKREDYARSGSARGRYDHSRGRLLTRAGSLSTSLEMVAEGSVEITFAHVHLEVEPDVHRELGLIDGHGAGLDRCGRRLVAFVLFEALLTGSDGRDRAVRRCRQRADVLAVRAVDERELGRVIPVVPGRDLRVRILSARSGSPSST